MAYHSSLSSRSLPNRLLISCTALLLATNIGIKSAEEEFYSSVPAEHAIRVTHSVTIWEEDYAHTAQPLTETLGSTYLYKLSAISSQK